ncbi:hypothetical protein NKH18_50230 [Streptomyces sp. M10(2022)]
MSLDCSYLIPEVGEPLLARARRMPHTLERHDVFDLIETAAGMPLGSAEVSVHAMVMDPATCAVLKCPRAARPSPSNASPTSLTAAPPTWSSSVCVGTD